MARSQMGVDLQYRDELFYLPLLFLPSYDAKLGGPNTCQLVCKSSLSFNNGATSHPVFGLAFTLQLVTSHSCVLRVW